jgi:ketosteroid isomerase-like protein
MTHTDAVPAVFAAIDAMDTPVLVDHLTPDATFVFANQPAAVGSDAIAGTVNYVFTTFKGLKHTITGMWEQGDTIVVRLSIDYTRHDDQVVTLPCVNIFQYEGAKIKDYRIYMDIAPVYA